MWLDIKGRSIAGLSVALLSTVTSWARSIVGVGDQRLPWAFVLVEDG